MCQKISIVLLCSVLLTQISCGKRKREDQYKEGEIVTWSYGNDFIIKATVGERRKHLVNTSCPKCERDFYRPRFEHYLGQFPIDYQPEKFPIMTLEEAETTPRGQRRAGYPALEFNLMLNGSWVEATDMTVNSSRALEHIDQIKVIVDFEKIKYKNTSLWKSYQANRKEHKRNIYRQYGLDCYFFDKTNSLTCFGKSKHPNSTVVLEFFGNEWIFGESWREDKSGQIKTKWRFDVKNIKHWQEIDDNIWRLLDVWNVSPVQPLK